MKRIKEFLKSPHIQIAIATGFSIIALAFVSKKILPEPMSYLSLAAPPFVATIYEAVLGKYKDAKICTAWYWVVAIITATGIVIVAYLISHQII